MLPVGGFRENFRELALPSGDRLAGRLLPVSGGCASIGLMLYSCQHHCSANYHLVARVTQLSVIRFTHTPVHVRRSDNCTDATTAVRALLSADQHERHLRKLEAFLALCMGFGVKQANTVHTFRRKEAVEVEEGAAPTSHGCSPDSESTAEEVAVEVGEGLEVEGGTIVTLYHRRCYGRSPSSCAFPRGKSRACRSEVHGRS